MIAYVQRETPLELIGKVLSILLMFPFVSSAIGQILYGVLFEQFETLPWIIIFASTFISVATAILSRSHFKKIS